MKKHTIKECRQLAENRGGKCLSEKYGDAHGRLLWECIKNHQWVTSYDSIRRGSWCGICAGKKKHTIEDCRKLAEKKEGRCLSTEYKDAFGILMWMCKLNHKWNASFHNIDQGKWCAKCYGNTRYTIEDCMKLAIERNGRCLSEVYGNVFTKYLWACNSEHKWLATFHNIQNGQWCPQCSSGKSQKHLIEVIKNLFPNFTVLYDYYGFDWLKTYKRKQHIDIFIKEPKIAVEYDGQQHFKPVEFWGGDKTFEETQQRDQNKDKLISEHPEDIKHFIRIPYWELINKDNVGDIFKKYGVII